MNEKILIKGKPYLYYPGIKSIDLLNKCFFLFSRSINENQKQYIFAKEEKNISLYSSAEKFNKDQLAANFIGNDNFIFENSYRYFRLYSDKKKDKAIKMYYFFQKKENLYKMLKKYSKLFSIGEEAVFESDDFDNFRKCEVLYKVRFYLKLFKFIILGTLKYLCYPFVFIKDIYINTIKSYQKFKQTEEEVKHYNNLSIKKKLLDMDKAEIDSKKMAKQKELEDIQGKYVNSSFILFTLLIALFSLLYSSIHNSITSATIQKQNTEYIQKIIRLEIENNEIKNKLDFKKLEDTLSKINENHDDLKLYVDNTHTKINNEINSLKEDIKGLKK